MTVARIADGAVLARSPAPVFKGSSESRMARARIGSDRRRKTAAT
jgi:hypothetical protein